MKTMLVLSMGALLLAGTLSAQTPVPEWQAGVDKMKSLIQTNPAQASEEVGELLKGKNKKNVDLVTSVAHVYLDAGHPGWHSVAEMTERLLQAGIGQAWGFALNVSHFQRTEDNIHYGQALVERLLPVLGQRKPFIVDTSRNGAGALEGQWCDPSGARLGEMSQVFPTGHSPEMLLWIKPPGEADGCGGPVGQFIPALAAQLIAHH